MGSNNETEVWTKPIGGKRTAVFIINTAVNNKTVPPTFPATDIFVAGGEYSAASTTAGSAGMSMVKCNSQRLSQYWTMTLGNTTNIKSDGYGNGCWEITGCNEGDKASVGTGV